MNSKPVSRAFNIAVQAIARRLFPLGYDVGEQSPQTFESLISHYQETGRILVWSGASDFTIYQDREINYAFRAWHDSKHVLFGFDFSRIGEESVMGKQWHDIHALYDGQMARYFCQLTMAEVRGRFDYQVARGCPPMDQRAFVLAYLENPESAVNGDFG